MPFSSTRLLYQYIYTNAGTAGNQQSDHETTVSDLFRYSAGTGSYLGFLPPSINQYAIVVTLPSSFWKKLRSSTGTGTVSE